MWSTVSYKSQYKVMKLLSDLADLEDDQEMKEAIIAAKSELDIWSNVPEHYMDDSEESFLVVRAVDQVPEE